MNLRNRPRFLSFSPSLLGNSPPSPEDKKLADTLCQACKLLGLRLLDNLIWTELGSTSYGPYAR